jgi:hypothetical protein
VKAILLATIVCVTESIATSAPVVHAPQFPEACAFAFCASRPNVTASPSQLKLHVEQMADQRTSATEEFDRLDSEFQAPYDFYTFSPDNDTEFDFAGSIQYNRPMSWKRRISVGQLIGQIAGERVLDSAEREAPAASYSLTTILQRVKGML